LQKPPISGEPPDKMLKNRQNQKAALGPLVLPSLYAHFWKRDFSG
jgi:hypothetical protein